MFKPIYEWTKQDLVTALLAWDAEFNDGASADEYMEMEYTELRDEVYARGIFETHLEKQ
jgi:hypothetical protein